MICLFALFFSAGLSACGPTNEEIAAREQARLQREAAVRQQEEARRQAEEAGQKAAMQAEMARQERIRAAVTAASQAAAEGRLDAALQRLQEALRDVRRYEGGGAGIGVQLAMENGFQVAAVFQDSPAYRAGIRASDRIVKVDGRPTQGMRPEDVIGLLRGQKGKPVTLTVVREGVSRPTDYQVVRDTVNFGDRQVREEIIKVVRAMPAPPALPEEAVRAMARGEAKVKIGGAGSYEGAAGEMEQAVLAAPWFADGYFNLGIVQEKADMLGQAGENLRLYLLAAPDSPKANAIRSRIYELEVMQEEEEKVQSLAGSWRSKGGNVYNLAIEGKKIRIVGTSPQTLGNGAIQKWRYAFDLETKGNSLEGTNTISHEDNLGCSFPNETVPASGMISYDGRYVKVSWKESIYSWTSRGGMCTRVSSLGKRDSFVELVERVTAEKQKEEAKAGTDIERAAVERRGRK